MTLLTPMPAPVWPTVTQPLSNRPPSGQLLFNQPLPSQPLSGQKLLDQPLISPRLPSLLPRAQPPAVQPSAVRPAVVQPPAAVPSSPAPTEHNTMGRPMRPRRLCRPVPGMGQPSLSSRPPPAATSVIPASSGTCRSLAWKCPTLGGAGRSRPTPLPRPSSSGIASSCRTSSRARRRTPGRTGKRKRSSCCPGRARCRPRRTSFTRRPTTRRRASGWTS